MLVLASCNRQEWEGRRIQRTLHKQQQQAERLTERLRYAIQANSFDSIWSYSQQNDNIVFYLYRGDKMVYWSNAWLNSSKRLINPVYDQWYFTRWDNAEGVCYRTQVNDFVLVVAIPIKYH